MKLNREKDSIILNYMSDGISVRQKFEDLLDELLNHTLLYSTLKLPLNL